MVLIKSSHKKGFTSCNFQCKIIAYGILRAKFGKWSNRGQKAALSHYQKIAHFCVQKGGKNMAKLGRGIYYRKKERRYVGKCHAGRSDDGSIIYAYVYGRTLAAVTEKLEAKRLEVAGQRNMRVYKGGFLSEWLLHFILEFVRNDVKQSTITTYYGQAEKHILPVLGHIKLCELTTAHVQDFVETLKNKGLSPITVKNIFGLLRMSVTKAENKNMLIVNPCRNIKLPELAYKEIKPFTVEQQAILEATNDIMVILPLFTGIRLGELAALRIENIDLKKGAIHIESTLQRVSILESKGQRKTKIITTVPKSKKSIRTIPLPTCVTELLKRYIKADRGYLLTNSDNYVMPRTIQNRYKSLIQKCGIEHTKFHTLRHTFATRCLEKSIDIKTLSEILGHANAAITMNIYCHSCDEHKRACMERLTFINAA